MKMRHRLFTLSLLLPLFAQADTVWMKNGDILSGKITIIDSNKLLISTKYAGEISIVTDQIKTFQTNEPTVIRNDLYSEKIYLNTIHPSEEEGAILIAAENGDEQTVSITNNLLLFKTKSQPLIATNFIFNGHIKGGFFYEKTTKKNQRYVLDTNLIIRHSLWRHNMLANLRRTLKDDTVNTYYYALQYDLDKFITPEFFWQSTMQYRYDWIEDIKSRKTFGTGPGYQLWDTELSSFSLALLANYQEMDYRDSSSPVNPFVTSLRWNYQQYVYGKTIKLFTSGYIGRSFNDTVTLDLSATAGISYKVTKWFMLSSTFTKEKDRTRYGDTDNTSYMLGFGIEW